MKRAKIIGMAILVAAAAATGGCSSIREFRGFVADPALVGSIQPGIDNKRSVEGTLGRPTFVSQYGEHTWYYVSSTNSRRPFTRPKIAAHQVLAVQFDAAGNVTKAQQSGIDQVVYLSPDGDKTPTLGRERSFLQDLFGNIGAVGAAGTGAGASPGT